MSERINQHLNPLVGNNIRRLRKERGLKATEVIAKLQLENVNVTTGIFSKVENGYNNPTVECDFNEFFKTEWEQFYYMIIYVDCSHFFVQ